MKASECYVGMKTTLPMEWAYGEESSRRKPMGKATCVWIHPQKLYAVFRFECGIRETVYLDDETRWAKNTVVPPIVVPPEMIRPRDEFTGNNAVVAETVKAEKVSRSEVSRKVGHSDKYLTTKLRDHQMDDEETAYWLDVIHETAVEKQKAMFPNENDPYYTIKFVLAENHLSRPAASRLLGYGDSWLNNQMRKPISIGKQHVIAENIKKRLSDRSESSQSDPTG